MSSPKLKFRKKIKQRDGIVLQDLANAITLDVKPKRGAKTQIDNTFSEQKKENDSCDYNHILTDVWFNIAEYINPEDVRAFALICRQTAYVVSCARFWSSLYRRFCTTGDTEKLPLWLKIRCQNQIGSLRSNVISALFYLYPRFEARIKKGYELSTVHGYKFISSWYAKLGPYWFFYYKLWDFTKTRKPKEALNEEDSSDEDGLSAVLNKLNNVFENPNEGVYLLIIGTHKFIPLPELHHSDMTLHSTRQLLNADLRNTNLKLEFRPARIQTPVLVEINYDCIFKHKVVPWWHPAFEKLQLLNIEEKF